MALACKRPGTGRLVDYGNSSLAGRPLLLIKGASRTNSPPVGWVAGSRDEALPSLARIIGRTGRQIAVLLARLNHIADKKSKVPLGQRRQLSLQNLKVQLILNGKKWTNHFSFSNKIYSSERNGSSVSDVTYFHESPLANICVAIFRVQRRKLRGHCISCIHLAPICCLARCSLFVIATQCRPDTVLPLEKLSLPKLSYALSTAILGQSAASLVYAIWRPPAAFRKDPTHFCVVVIRTVVPFLSA